jgi:[acyl-carrier-protein] S-malonyltransferase
VSTAFLFAGQGSQAPGMGAELVESCGDCRSLFLAADSALGCSLSRVMLEGPAEELRRTAVAQPALLTLAVAHARHLIDAGMTPDYLSGHSLGQYSALVVAGALDFDSAVRLVAARGRLMQEAVPEGMGSMAAIVGLDREVIYAICRSVSAREVVNVACHNAPNQTVISGAKEAVAAASDLCDEQGGGVVPMEVSAPFHCELLRPMVKPFTDLINSTPFSDPAIPIIDNVTARPLLNAAAVRQSLIEQITSPVLFEESTQYLFEAGARRFVQCGPGNSLLAFAKRTVRGVELETFASAVQRAAPV